MARGAKFLKCVQQNFVSAFDVLLEPSGLPLCPFLFLKFWAHRHIAATVGLLPSVFATIFMMSLYAILGFSRGGFRMA